MERDNGDVVVTPEMAKAGAEELRERHYGESLEEVATDVFYAMQAALRDSDTRPKAGDAKLGSTRE